MKINIPQSLDTKKILTQILDELLSEMNQKYTGVKEMLQAFAAKIKERRINITPNEEAIVMQYAVEHNLWPITHDILVETWVVAIDQESRLKKHLWKIGSTLGLIGILWWWYVLYNNTTSGSKTDSPTPVSTPTITTPSTTKTVPFSPSTEAAQEVTAPAKPTAKPTPETTPPAAKTTVKQTPKEEKPQKEPIVKQTPKEEDPIVKQTAPTPENLSKNFQKIQDIRAKNNDFWKLEWKKGVDWISQTNDN